MEIIKLKSTNHKEIIKKASRILAAGGLLVYPTETCYGIGGDATNERSISKLLKYKTKRADKAISVAVSDLKMATKYVQINKAAKNIYQNFLPGPVTVISKSKNKLAKNVASSQGTQGIRIPDYQLIIDLVKNYKKPITATSANASYKKTPYTIKDIFDNITVKQKQMIDLVIDAGRLPKREPSTVIDTTLDNIYIVRQGAMKLQAAVKYQANNLEETNILVDKILTEIKTSLGKKTVVFALQGDLGAGKTYFTKFLAQKFKIKQVVVSPTFNIMREYQGKYNNKKINFYHLDAYRLFTANELDELEPQKVFKSPNIVVIEWANKVLDYIKKYTKSAVVVLINIKVQKNGVRLFEYEIKK